MSEPGLRRVPPPDLADVGADAELVTRIADEIRERGPIPFARFMERALYEPGHGYYRSLAARPGRSGDFLTAPETDPIFGAALARQLVEVWERLGRPDPFVVREPGSGSGALAAATLRALRATDADLAAVARWQPADVEPARDAELRAGLADAGVANALVADDGRPIVGAVVANEVLDALPVHRLVGRPDGPREMLVDLAVPAERDPAAVRFVDVEAPLTDPRLAGRLAAEGVTLADGQRAEVCLAIDDWVRDEAARLARGILLAIDYGYPAAELYDPVRRRDGTLAAYVRHTVHDDPYRHVGRQDLTAHVDVAAVERAATAAGLDHLGTTSQAEFLAGLGIGDLLVAIQSDPATTLEGYLATRAAVMRMIDPAAMGRFRVMVFGRGVPPDPPLTGLATRVRRSP